MDRTSEYPAAMLRIIGEHALDFTSAIYGHLLHRLLPSVQTGDWHSNTLVLPFVFPCAANLEATLNDHLVAYAFSEYDIGEYLRPAESLLSMNLRSKLDRVVPLLSNNRFLVRTESKQYQSLLRLIRLRNELVHSKSFFVECVKWNDEENEPVFDKKQSEKMLKRGIRSVEASNCIESYQAVKSLDECFFYPLEAGKLTDNKPIKEKHEQNHDSGKQKASLVFCSASWCRLSVALSRVLSTADVLFLPLPKSFDLIHKSTILPGILSPWELFTFMASSIQFV